MTKKTLGILTLFILLLPQAYAKAPYFIEKSPNKGEGIYAFLKRYKLDNNSCNLKKFLSLNRIKKNTALLHNKKYKLPIYIYSYNGKSIRTTIKRSDYKNALAIKKYNKAVRAKKLRQTHYIDSKLLWVPYSNVGCKNTIKTVKSRTNARKIKSSRGKSSRGKSTKRKTVSLFGRKYRNVNITNNRLKNRVYYILSGHGGPDPGARYVSKSSTLCEDEYAYDVSLRLARTLMQQSATVYMIIQDRSDGIRDASYLACDKDERSIHNKRLPLNQRARLKQRTDDVNVLYKKHQKSGVKSQIMLAIHVDSRSYEKRKDVFFYHSPQSRRGKRAALTIHKRLKQNYLRHQKSRGYHGTVSARDLYVLENSYPTSVFIELGNIHNTYDRKRIMLAGNRQALANWISTALGDIAR